MKRLLVLVSLLVVASMLLGACATPAATTSAPTTAAATTAAPQETTTQAPAEGPKSKDPTTFVYATIGDIDTLDPALAYDTASGEVIQNVYETLIFYKGESTSDFIPQLATEVPSVDNGGVSADGMTWTWKIRSGVKFHNGDTMTPSDVAFSFQRGLLQGGTASPQWLLYEAFFGVGVDDVSLLVDPNGGLYDDREALMKADPAALKAACEKVQAAVVADDAAGTVTFHLANPWGPMLPTLAQTWGSVMDAKWVKDNGGWDGTCDTWQNFYAMDAANDPFTSIANGTGPYVLDHRTPGQEIVMTANPNYWRTEPAYEGGPSGVPAIKTAMIKIIPEWGTRFSMLQAGDADIVDVPVESRSQADALVGEKCPWDDAAGKYGTCEVVDNAKPLRLLIGRPGVTTMDVIIYNFNIKSSEEKPNPYIGSGKLDGNGIPGDFFSDVHIRKAFSYAFDWDTFIADVYKGEAVQAIELPMPGMIGYDPNAPHYTFDLDKATAEFKLADVDKDGIAAGDETDGSDVWNTGFRMQMLYNQGNTTRQIIAEVEAGSMSTINPKFQIEVLGLPWPSYLAAQRAGQIPVMTAGWQEDIADPHNWYQPYTTGAYGGRQNMPADMKAQFKELLDKGVAGVTPEARAEVYKQMNQLYYDLVPGVPIDLATSHGFEQRWVTGRVFNPLFSGMYFYPMSKQ